METVQEGFWSIAAQKHLKAFTQDSSNIDEYDKIDIAGKSGRFLGAIRGNSKIESILKVEKIANTVGIKPSELYKIILPGLSQASGGRVELIKNTAGDITGVAEYVFTNNEVITVAGEVFEKLNPKEIERITLQTLDSTKRIPLTQSELFSKLARDGFTEKDIAFALSLQKQFKLIQSLSKLNPQDPMISNEYIWGHNHEKIAYALANVSLDNKQSLEETISEIQKCQGMPTEELRSKNFEIINLAQKIGMINPINIISTRGIEKEFSFSADISSTTDNDIMDDVKVLLASIRFGERYTEHSTIQDPIKFLEALINNESVGPHSANSTDYIMLEKKGILKVVQETKSKWSYYTNNTYTKSGPCLKLIKKDVAEKAIEILKSPDYCISKGLLQEPEIISDTGNYRNSEEIRIFMAELPEPIKEASEMLTKILRDELI